MLKLIGGAAIAAMLAFAPAETAISTETTARARPATMTVAAIGTAAPKPDFGLTSATESGLAPGQTAADFRTWLRASPANAAKLASFRDHLAAQGVDKVVPMWQLVRTSSSWKRCGAEPFEAPPADKWDHIVKTLQFVRDEVEPAIGEVEPLSAYRNEGLNACSNGAPKSAHRHFFALDLTPVNKALARGDMIRSVCAAHARDGRAYDTGLGFYSGRRFHVDSSGFRKWGPNGKGATSPCVARA